MKPNNALTTRWSGISMVLGSEIGISEPFVPPANVANLISLKTMN